MLRQIPGHVRAFTWMLATVAGVVSWMITGSWNTPLGMIVVVIGEFLGNQATHLAQHHAEQPPTWLEIQQQRHNRLFQVLGLSIVALGIWIAFK